ncbi:MAG: toxic anion resistance protein [Burkholderiaceae bacterium]|nr:toxic anion resistance protein [Burkholderiaceae bacterium]
MSTEVSAATITQAPEKLESVLNWLSVPNAPAPTDPEIEQQAQTVVGTLLNADATNVSTIAQHRQSFESMGAELQKESGRRSEMLKQPVHKLYENAVEGGPVANALVDLKMKVEELDPGQMDLKAGWVSRTMGKLPFVGTPLKRYFSKYESSKTALDAIIRSLRDGKDNLQRDNVTLNDDQKAMRVLCEKIEKTIDLGQLIDTKLSSLLERELNQTDPRYTVIQNEWLFPLRQRIMDLQQQLAVNQQGILSLELIIRNNVELMRGVDRAVNVTVSALQVAVTLALALANQRITLEKIQAVNETTDKLIAQNAKNLRTQGAEIHKMAAGTSLNMETLKQAFADIRGALEDVATFRQQALPQMATNIKELDKLTEETSKAIADMEKAKQMSSVIQKELGQI